MCCPRGGFPLWVVGIVLTVTLFRAAEAQLSSEKKQEALDLHNDFRRQAARMAQECSRNVRQLQWDETLAESAQAHADRCYATTNPRPTINHPTLGPAVKKGENFYIASDSKGAMESAVQSWFNGIEDANKYKQLVWPNTSLVGCGMAECQKLSRTDGTFTSGYLVICDYITSFIAGTPLFPGAGLLQEQCYNDPDLVCIDGLCASSTEPPTVPEDDTKTPTSRNVWWVQSPYGSVGGGKRITIHGEGFSTNQFAGGNEVVFTDGTIEFPCDVIPYYSRANPTGNDRIVCDTRPSPYGDPRSYQVIVRVDDGDGVKEETTCSNSNNCRFTYHDGWTPWLTRLTPLAMSAASNDTLVQIYGRIFTTEFQEDLDDENSEYIQRILVGGRACEPMDEDGELYGVSLSNIWGSVYCLPNLLNIVDSMNVTAFMRLRGSLFIRHSDNLLAIDNKLRAYSFQTYAEITGVYPSSGSTEGGTRITVTVDIALNNYTDTDVKVFIGGISCENVTLVPPNMVMCTSGPQPSSSTYYPGSRGLLREVWTGTRGSIDEIESFGRSNFKSRQERTFRSTSDPREFNEDTFFSQRWSGFFIPPESCLYTFSVRSDDPGRLFLSPDMSPENKTLIAYAPSYSEESWDRFDTQTSEPIRLEKGTPYYLETHSLNYGGPYEIGFGAKIHCYDYTTYPYNGDTEQQVIDISSTVVNEEHTIHITTQPAVQTVTVTYNGNQMNASSVDNTVICLRVGDEEFSFSVVASPEEIESSINDLDSVINIGYITVLGNGNNQLSDTVQLTFVFVSNLGVSAADLPLLSVNSNPMNCHQSVFTVTVETVQSLVPVQSVNLGFSETAFPRYTPSLAVNELTAEIIHEQLTQLFGYECTDSVPTDESMLRFRVTFEESEEGYRDNSTSYCGLYSLNSPETLWQSSGDNDLIDIITYDELCFAYYTSSFSTIPAVRMNLQYYDTDTRVAMSDTLHCQLDTTTFLSWDYSCINLRSCFDGSGGGLNPRATHLYFGSEDNLWIDEVSLTTSEPSVTRNAPPVHPGGVPIKYIEVGGEFLEAPILMVEAAPQLSGMGSGKPPYQLSGMGSGKPPYQVSGMGSGEPLYQLSGSGKPPHQSSGMGLGKPPQQYQYLLIIANFTITYAVDDCMNGIPLVEGYQMAEGEEEATSLWTERAALATPPVTGTFDLNLNGHAISKIDAQITGSELDTLLENNFFEEGDFAVSREGTCSGYQWLIKWETKLGDVEQMTVNGDGLNGKDVEINVERELDGGLWIRPLRADMLRLPEDAPQVEVIINDIPSSCDNYNCSFNFTKESTPQVFDFYPNFGQGGTEVTLYGTRLTNDVSSVIVTIGGSLCNVIHANTTQITCVAADHVAGWYSVSVFIEDIGYASINQSLCFNYLLTVSSISPEKGSIGGGITVTITGNGFFDFESVDTTEFEYTTALKLPWFASGFALPTIENFYKLCPELLEEVSFDGKDSLNSTIFSQHGDSDFESVGGVSDIYSLTSAIYSGAASFVRVGGLPCVLISGDLNTIECVLLPHYPGQVNVSAYMLTVFEEVTLEEEFEYSLDYTPKITSITPSSGPASGGTIIQIEGTNLVPDDSDYSVTVQIGTSACDVTNVTNTTIICITKPHAPGITPIFVRTATGLAVLCAADYTNSPPDFPLFTYQFSVSSVQPSEGSVLGGTTLTVHGTGLMDAQVYIGEKMCEMQSTADAVIECVTPSSSQTHPLYLEDHGFDPEVRQFLFSWSKSKLSISIRDTVTWEWKLERSGFVANLFQTPNNFSSTVVAGGFRSKEGATEVFSYTFYEKGTYYYATEVSHTFPVHAVIEVGNLRSSMERVQVFDTVNGFSAENDPFVGGDSGSGPELRPGYHDNDTVPRNSNICQVQEKADDFARLENQEDSSPGPFVFTYSFCDTPVVYSVSPSVGTLGTNFTIDGIGFSPEEVQNKVLFSGTECSVVASNETQIICQFSEDSLPPPFTELSLTILVTDLGNALIFLPASATVSISPVVLAINPKFGSVAGGTDVVFSGWGFPTSGFETQISIGGSPCEVTSQSYSYVQCTTGPNTESNQTILMSFYSTDEVKKRATGVFELQPNCAMEEDCTFEYSLEVTPIVTAISTVMLQGPEPTIVTLNGSGFSESPVENEVLIGEYPCITIRSSSSQITCEIDPIPAGFYLFSLRVCEQVDTDSFVDSECVGLGQIELPVREIESVGIVMGVTPDSGSIQGGTTVKVSGAGFSSDASLVFVTINGNPCTVSSANYSHVVCRTPKGVAGTFAIELMSHGISFSSMAQYTYSNQNTPKVTGISPGSGQSGDIVEITGTNLGHNIFGTLIAIGGSPCKIADLENDDTTIHCMVGPNLAGEYSVAMNIEGLGNADTGDTIFTYTLELDDFSPKNGSFAGRNPIMLTGIGLDPNFITITICDKVCELTVTPSTLTSVECEVPPVESEMQCQVTVESRGESKTYVSLYEYLEILTPHVVTINDTRGGTQGGTGILLTGTGFTGPATVTIAETKCEVKEQTETTVICVTGASGRTIRDQVIVAIDGDHFAVSEGIEFWYVDLWSSVFTWGGGPLPREGDFVVIPKGQTLVLDTITPVLSYLLIQGGELIFDDEQEDDMVQLHTEGALIIQGGRLQIGTEVEPFMHKTRLVLYGHVLSTEVPVYGAKTLALREGEIDMHGRPLNVTWTRLAQTANPGDRIIHLQEAVDWEVGGKIVIASTSHSQRENEELQINSIDETGTMLTISPGLEYEHISIQQEIEGRFIDTSAEVGYLTRNILVRGNLNQEWVEEVEGCDKEFRPGQFAIQTCFLGRFGDETLSDQFGSQIMIHAAEQNQGDVVGRFEYIEVTHAGQAFRLGRYPIHFHLNGDVSTSYVRGCAIHHTFNRAVTVHAVDYLLIEKNVAYDVLGHAYFLEDGIEQHNIIQDNLGIFVRGSSSLLNVDITPATFWMVNPNNIVRRNAAAGGTHFGYWYRLPVNPTGPSATSTVCPRKMPLEEFADNTAHSFGWYGLWVFPGYDPRLGGGCNDWEHTPAVFERFLAWRNNRGIEFHPTVGSLQVHDSILLDNRLAGIDIANLNSVWGENGGVVKDTLIVGHSALSPDGNTCTSSGIVTPPSYYLTVSGVTFVNFDRPSCFALKACSGCKGGQGGFETRYQNITFVNSPRITLWGWEHQHVHRFLDNSLGTSGPSSLIPSSNILSPTLCQPHSESTHSETNGSICDGSVDFVRFQTAGASITPGNLRTSDLYITSPYGTSVLPYLSKRIITEGQMGILEKNQSYHLDFPDGRHFTNITYAEILTAFGKYDYLIFSQTFPRSLDVVKVNGQGNQQNDTIFDDPGQAVPGDWYMDDNHTLFYIVKGSEDPTDLTHLSFSSTTCAFEGCVFPTPPPLPPPERPDVIVRWSNASIWPNNELPKPGEDVYINCSLYVVVDIQIPRLGRITICGGLELDDSMDHVVEADLIFLKGGVFIVGYPDTLFTHKARIVLHGNKTSPETYLPMGPVVGAKAMGVFGELIIHAETHEILWTRLAETANAGSDMITVTDNIEWDIGTEIVITSTSFEALETETFEIVEITGRDIFLDGTLQFTHIVEGEHPMISAEVGLLTRNIVIESGGLEQAEDEAFGCRVLVGSYIDDNSKWFVGSAQIHGVEFKGCGQDSFIESYDPRFSLAFLSIGTTGYGSYVRSSSFHDGYNTAIGVFGTNEVIIDNNVIYDTVGPSVIVEGLNHNVMKNLASLSRFPGTYRRSQPSRPEWTANFEVHDTEGLILTGNAAAGGAKAGFHTRGVACTGNYNSRESIVNNIAHSVLHGVHAGYQTSDGHPSGCAKFHFFTVYSCYHYGIFSYTDSAVVISDTLLANNYAATFTAVVGPHPLSHIVGDKTVTIERSTIVSATSQFDCEVDGVAPIISEHRNSFKGIKATSGGHAGILIPTFAAGGGGYPLKKWPSILSYPTISGRTTISDVTFDNFNERCDGLQDRILLTYSSSEDCYHPIFLQGINILNSDPELLVFNHMPNLGSVNPADCVDMDCDGMKKLLIKDMDGSFTKTGQMTSLTSVAEFEWDMDPRRGLGDYRIPKAMLSYPNGSRIFADDAYPNKGIVRGTSSDVTCEYKPEWNMYQCTDIDYLMLVIESLDPDTEVRRLSPIGIGANGYIDLLNGPQDHGWCGGYTCQERISTFYSIVAAGLVYTVGLTSTNPQNMALHLLHSDTSQSIVIKLIYNSPQRLDVYYNGTYVVPKNAMQQADGNLVYFPRDAHNPHIYNPTVDDPAGSNYYDRDYKQLHMTIRGSRRLEVRTQPVIQVALDIFVSIDDFFDPEHLVRNLAFILGIPDNRIRVVDVIRESPTGRRRRQEDGSDMYSVILEVGDPPGGNTTMDSGGQLNKTSGTGANMTMETVTELTYAALEAIEPAIVQSIQTGEILMDVNATLVGATIQSAEPPTTDPTNGIRATNGTGGIQPNEVAELNMTIPTYYDMQLKEEAEEENATKPLFISIPTYLDITQQPSMVREGVVFTEPPALAMYDERDNIVESLGRGDPWILTASIRNGPERAYLTNADVLMIGGLASFDNLTLSHPGTYILEFNITYPPTADPSIYDVSVEFTVVERTVSVWIATQPTNGNITFPLYPYPEVYVIDDQNDAVVNNLGWRNRTWSMIATARDLSTGRDAGFQWTVELMEGKAVFTDIVFPKTGRYRLVFNVSTEPRTQIQVIGEPSSYTSNVFRIVSLPMTRIIVVYDVNCKVVLGEGKQAFIDAFFANLLDHYEGIEFYDAIVECGSVNISFFATAPNRDTLQDFVDDITSTNDTLTFIYNSQLLVPLIVIQDPNYLLTEEDSEDEQLLILATTISSGTLLLCTTLLICVVCLCQRLSRRNKIYKVSVKPVAVNPAYEDRCIEHSTKHFPPDSESMDSFYPQPEHKVKDLEAQSLEMSELASNGEGSEMEFVVSHKIKVPATTSKETKKAEALGYIEIKFPDPVDSSHGGEVHTNPDVITETTLSGLDGLQDNLEEIFTRSMTNSSSNNNNDDSPEKAGSSQEGGNMRLGYLEDDEMHL